MVTGMVTSRPLMTVAWPTLEHGGGGGIGILYQQERREAAGGKGDSAVNDIGGDGKAAGAVKGIAVLPDMQQEQLPGRDALGVFHADGEGDGGRFTCF